MRGLKLLSRSCLMERRSSHLLQMRGLKHHLWYAVPQRGKVASFTDAWIETIRCLKNKRCVLSHLLQMRGLKLSDQTNEANQRGRIFYRCVDWNLKMYLGLVRLQGRIFYRCVDWNKKNLAEESIRVSRIFYRCVDWNTVKAHGRNLPLSHLLQMRGLKLKR